MENTETTHVVTEMLRGDVYTTVTVDAGYSFSLRSSLERLVVGDTIRVSTAPLFGGKVRGLHRLLAWSCPGTWDLVYWKSDEDLQQEYDEYVAKNRADALAKKPEADAKLAKLPDVFQKRIARFRKNNPDFDANFLSYEVFVCEQAVLIADSLFSADAVRSWWRLENPKDGYLFDLPEEEQAERKARFKELVPGLSDEHSGNTFGAAVSIAVSYLEDPRRVEFLHGAMDPLVGCVAYGCFASESDEEKDRVLAELFPEDVVQTADGEA